MALCEYCIEERFKKCELTQTFETESGFMRLRAEMLIKEDPALIAEVVEVELEREINRYRGTLRVTALERGCVEFK